MSTAYIGIGSNLGKKENNCLEAVGLIKANGLKVIKQSGLHETEPWGMTDQPLFINMAIEVETAEDPGELLKILKGIEKQMGRGETTRWGPRVIDLDILFYDNLIINKPGLVIPHPLMHEREFVLKPLCEIAPEKVHLIMNKTIKTLLGILKKEK